MSRCATSTVIIVSTFLRVHLPYSISSAFGLRFSLTSVASRASLAVRAACIAVTDPSASATSHTVVQMTWVARYVAWAFACKTSCS